MKKLRFPSLILIVALALSLAAPTARAIPAAPADHSHAAVLVAEDGGNETVLFTKNAQERVYPASLTKIMTVLLAVEAIENGTAKLSDMVTAQPGFDFDMIIGGSSVYMATGETMSLENLLYCAMVASANEVCNVIGTYIGGSLDNFLAMMNQRARELGCTDTNFANTHGLPNPNHYTTAWDFSRILREAATHELFMQICNTVDYTVPDTNVASERHLENTNSLINPTNYLYPGDYGYEYAKGVKTGHTSDAGYCLASTAEKDGVTLLCIVMNCQTEEAEDGSLIYGHFIDSRALFQWGFENFSYQEIIRSSELVGEVAVTMGADADSVSLRPSASINALLPNDVSLDDFVRTVTLDPEVEQNGLTAPVNAGQAVGEITVTMDGQIYGVASVVTSTSVDMSRTQFMKNQLMDTLRQPGVVFTFWGLLFLFILYLLLVVRYRAKRRAYQKRLEAARQVRLDLEDEEDEIRYERRARSSGVPRPGPARLEIALEPETLNTDEDEPVEEPTRVSGPTPAVEEPVRDQPTVVMMTPEEKPPKPAETPKERSGDPLDQFFEKK